MLGEAFKKQSQILPFFSPGKAAELTSNTEERVRHQRSPSRRTVYSNLFYDDKPRLWWQRRVDKTREVRRAAGDCKWPSDEGWLYDDSRKERECLRHSKGRIDKTSQSLLCGGWRWNGAKHFPYNILLDKLDRATLGFTRKQGVWCSRCTASPCW